MATLPDPRAVAALAAHSIGYWGGGAAVSMPVGGFIVPVVSRADWVAKLLTCKDTPYVHQGRLPGVGMDCIGQLIWGSVEFGLKPVGFDITGYPQQPDGSFQAYLDEHLERVPRDQLGLGDVVLNGFRLEQPRHIAVIVGERYGQWEMLHADSTVGRVQVERIQYGRRHYRFVQGYHMPGVA